MKRKDEFDYFGCFIKTSKYACDAANYLADSLRGFNPDTLEMRMGEMHEIENDADGCKHEMIRRLSHEFITPIEREDIVSLAQELDNVTDTIDDVMRKLYMYDVRVLRPEALDFCTLIIRCTDALYSAITEFRNFKRSKSIHELIVSVNSLETEGDHLHARATRALFREADADRLTWMNIFDCLENCLDACEHVSDVVESIVMKNT